MNLGDKDLFFLLSVKCGDRHCNNIICTNCFCTVIKIGVLNEIVLNSKITLI